MCTFVQNILSKSIYFKYIFIKDQQPGVITRPRRVRHPKECRPAASRGDSLADRQVIILTSYSISCNIPITHNYRFQDSNSSDEESGRGILEFCTDKAGQDVTPINLQFGQEKQRSTTLQSITGIKMVDIIGGCLHSLFLIVHLTH